MGSRARGSKDRIRRRMRYTYFPTVRLETRGKAKGIVIAGEVDMSGGIARSRMNAVTVARSGTTREEISCAGRKFS